MADVLGTSRRKRVAAVAVLCRLGSVKSVFPPGDRPDRYPGQEAGDVPAAVVGRATMAVLGHQDNRQAGKDRLEAADRLVGLIAVVDNVLLHDDDREGHALLADN